MKRRTNSSNSSKTADANLTADLHIRGDIPVCRTDNYLESQFKKLEFIFELCKQENAPLLVAGDIGNKSQWSNWLLEKTISLINKYNIDIICIPGQHDLPEHRLEYWQKSGCGVLHGGYSIFVIQEEQIINDKFILFPFPYGKKITSPKYDKDIPKIAITHQMVIENKKLWPDQIAPEGNALLKKHPEYSLILSGDNHFPFIAECHGRLLVNPGSMMRMTAAQIEHTPRVYKWFADTNTVKAVYLPIEKGVITRLHIEDKEIRDKRMDAFVSRMTDDFEIGLSFSQNMEEYFRANRTKQSIKDKTWAAMEVNK
jgi:DNA repair exonuclease SbcCD nuclease subunit